MLASLSPYQLLKSCVVKAPAQTPYDYPDAAQISAAEHLLPNAAPAQPLHSGETTSAYAPAQLRRTHYISDIHSRHIAAQRSLRS